LHRKLNFALALVSVTAAAGCLVGSTSLLRVFDLRPAQLVAAKQAEVQEQMSEMTDEVRKITKRMGFNILILPQDQNLADFYAENYADKFMPEEYADRLANTKGIVTIRHLLPMLQQRIDWAEQQRRILLIGVRGEMPWSHRANKLPILKPVRPGTVMVGHELHRSLGLNQGDKLTLRGREFEVAALNPERGTIDDITLWVDLKEAQELLGREGVINSMMALECGCAWADVSKVREEIGSVLPDTQVIELAGKALGRAEARLEAARNAALVVERERLSREALRREREKMIAMVVPLLVAGCALWIALLAFGNVRERAVEIGVLRAVGLRSADILCIFLGKAVLLGFVGAAVGLVAGALAGPWLPGMGPRAAFSGEVLSLRTAVLVVVLAPLVTAGASLVPAVLAARQDPAVVLREE